MKGLSLQGAEFSYLACVRKKKDVTWMLESNTVFFLGSRNPTRTSGGNGQAREVEDSH